LDRKPGHSRRVGALQADCPLRPVQASPASSARRAAVVGLLCSLVLAGCSSPPPPKAKASDYVYRVGPVDVLTIEVWNEPGLEEREVTVTPDGFVSFPMVSGTLEVSDMTLAEVAHALRDKLLAVLSDPIVTVTLRESRSAQVQMLGEIGQQGRVPYRKDLSLIEAIAEAGGLGWETAKLADVRVVRGALVDPVLLEVDLENLLDAEQKDIFLEPGDIVVVPAKWVTRYSRYMTQLLAPVAVAIGAASTATLIGYGPVN